MDQFMRLLTRVLAGAGAAAATLVLAGPASAASLPTGNLVANGNAEGGPGVSDSVSVFAPPGWETSGPFTAVSYSAPDSPARPSAGGANYFAGGPANGESSARQLVDVVPWASQIDAGRVRAALSALVGGWRDQDDYAQVSAVFYSAAGAELGVVTLPWVGPSHRNDESKLLSRATIEGVPRGTRAILVVLQASRDDGEYNDGYVDNVSLRLVAAGTAAPRAKLAIERDCDRLRLTVSVVTANASPATVVVFVIAGRKSTPDKSPPFGGWVSLAGLPARFTVQAFVRYLSDETVILKRTVENCAAAGDPVEPY